MHPWPFISMECIFQGGQQMAQHLWVSKGRRKSERSGKREKENGILL